MTVGSVISNNGVFSITTNGKTQQVDLGTLMMMLNLDRVKNLDTQLAIQVDDIKERNNQIADLTAFMAECRSRKANKSSDFNILSSTQNGEPFRSIQQGFDGAWTTTKESKDDTKAAAWDANINAVKGKIDNLNNDSQMANIKLQNLLDKRSNAFEMATKVMDTNNQSVQSTLRNL